MRNSALDLKMRTVDLGVVTCIDAIIRNAETLLKDGTNPAEQANAKAEIRKNAHLYKQALDELLGVLDADKQGDFAKNPQNLTRCSACGIDDEATDNAMENLCVTTTSAISIPYIIQRLIDTIGDKKALENTLYNFSEIAEIYLRHVEAQRQALQNVIIAREKGGKDE